MVLNDSTQQNRSPRSRVTVISRSMVLLASHIVFFMSPEISRAKPIESYPLVGAVSTGVSWNHSQFVGQASANSTFT